MANKYAIRTETLTGIADAIRSKTGSDGTILTSALAEHIAQIPSYIVVASVEELPADAAEGTVAVVMGAEL